MITPDFSQIILFLSATLLLNLTPGADVLYIASPRKVALAFQKITGVLFGTLAYKLLLAESR